MNGEKLYQELKLGNITKSQLTESQIGEVYKYMVNSKKVPTESIKPEVAEKYNIAKPSYVPSRSPDTNIPITPSYTPSRSIDTNAPIIPYQPPKSLTPEMELVDTLSNLSMGRNLNAVNQIERERPGITWENTPIQAIGENVRAGWNQFGRTLPNTIDMILGDKGIKVVDDYLADQRRQQAEEAERLAKINVTPVQKFAGSVAQGVGQSAPYALEGIVMAPYFASKQAGQFLTKGGTQLMQGIQGMMNPTLSQKAQQTFVEAVTNPNFIISTLSSSGSIFQDSINKGATREQAINAAITGGIPSGLVEVMGGAENLGQQLAKKQPWTRQAFESGMSEALEEIVQYVFEGASKKIAYDKDMPLYSTTEEAVINPNEQAYAGASAFLSSGILGGAGSAIDATLNKLDSNQQQIVEEKATPSQPTVAEVDSLIDLLNKTKEQLPELTEFADDNIRQLNEYKNQVAEADLSNENVQADQTVEEDTKVALTSDTDVTEGVKGIDTKEEAEPTEYIPTQEELLQELEEQDKLTQETEAQDEFPISTIEAKNGIQYEIKSKDKDLITVLNKQTNQEQQFTEGALKRMGVTNVTEVAGTQETLVQTTEQETATEDTKAKKVTIQRRIPSNELSTTELIQRVKAEGKDLQSSYGLFVKERDLKPEIDSKEFNKIFNSVSPDIHIETTETYFTPTHKYLGKDVMLSDVGSHYTLVAENGMTGTETKPLRKDFTPINKEQEIPKAEEEIKIVDEVTETKTLPEETNDIRIVDGEVFYKNKDATTAKTGFAWFSNKKSRFNNDDRKTIMLPEFLETEQTTEIKETVTETKEEVVKEQSDVPSQFVGETPQSEETKVADEGKAEQEVVKDTKSDKVKQTTQGLVEEQGAVPQGNQPVQVVAVDMSRPLKRPTQIRDFITKAFGVPTSSKRFKKRKFAGFYKVIPETIRLKYDNDLGTVMHELGHHLDKKYDFHKKNKQLVQDMIAKLDPLFQQAYQASELPGEAIAEFLRYYTANPTQARQFAGQFYDVFESSLSKKDLKNVQEIREDTMRWVYGEVTEKAESTIIPQSKTKVTIKEKTKKALTAESINMALFDAYQPLKTFAETVERLTGKKISESLNPHLLATLTYKNSSIIEGIIRHQLKDPQLNDLNTKDSIERIMDDVGKDKMTSFELYLKVKHALTLKQLKDHTVFSKELDAQIVNPQWLAMQETQHPEFVNLSNRLYDWYDMFFKAWVVDTNMLGKDSKKVYDQMRKMYPYYVPMFKAKRGTKQSKSGIANQGSVVDRLSAKGSDADTISPIDGIISQVARIYNAQTKNNIMRVLVEHYNNVDGLGMFFDKVSSDMERKIVSTENIKDTLLKDFEGIVDAADLDAIVDSIDEFIIEFRPKGYSTDNEIITMVAKDGSRQFYEVFDENLLKALGNMNHTQLDISAQIISNLRRTMTALTTGLNPIFGIASNAPRDYIQGYVYGSYINPVEYGVEYAKAIYNIIKRTDQYKKFAGLGGVYGSSMTATEIRGRNDFIRKLDKYRAGKATPKNALSFIGELILDFSDAIETAPRLSEFNKAYKVAKKEGKTEQNALLYAITKANDVTLNFSARGEIMNTAVGQSIPYLNAGLRGIDKMKRGLITDKEVRKQTWLKSLAALTLPTILLWLAHRDDEDYKKLSNGIKDNYWILWKTEDGSFFRVPKPKDIAALFSPSVERAFNAYFDEQGLDAFKGFEDVLADSMLPPVDTIFRALIDIEKNEKWSGGPIVSQSLGGYKPAQYDDTTSKIGIGIARAVAVFDKGNNFASPKNVDYALDQYYGILSDILLPLTTPNNYTPIEAIRRKFTADPSYSNDAINNFYDLREKTTDANKAFKDKGIFSDKVDFEAEEQFKLYYKGISSQWKSIDYIGTLENAQLPEGGKEAFTKLIDISRYSKDTKQKVKDDLKDNKLNKESIKMLQKTVRDEIVNLSEKAIKEYKVYHKESNEFTKQENKK